MTPERKRQKPIDRTPAPHLLTFRVTPEQYMGVAFLAETLDLAHAEVLRRALDHYFKSQTNFRVGDRKYPTLLAALEAGEQL